MGVIYPTTLDKAINSFVEQFSQHSSPGLTNVKLTLLYLFRLHSQLEIMVAPKKETDALLQATGRTNGTPIHTFQGSKDDKVPRPYLVAGTIELAFQGFEDVKALGLHLMANTVELTSQGFIGTEGYKIFVDEGNLVKRLATYVVPQDRPYLALGHSLLAFEAFALSHIRSFDLKVDLA